MVIDNEFIEGCLDYRATPEEIAHRKEAEDVAAAALHDVASECVRREFTTWFPVVFPYGHVQDSLLFGGEPWTDYTLYDAITFTRARAVRGCCAIRVTQLVLDYIATLPTCTRAATVPEFTLERNAFMWRLVLTGRIETDIVRVGD